MEIQDKIKQIKALKMELYRMLYGILVFYGHEDDGGWYRAEAVGSWEEADLLVNADPVGFVQSADSNFEWEATDGSERSATLHLKDDPNNTAVFSKYFKIVV